MAQGNLNDESVRLQEQFISMGAKISEAIKDAVRDAADSIDATVSQRVGKSLVSTFTALARFTEEASQNTFKISQGLIDSEGIAKQLLTLEEKRLTLTRQKQLAELAGIAFKDEDYQAALLSIDAQQQMLEGERKITDAIEDKVGLIGKLSKSLSSIPGLGKVLNVKELDTALRKAAAAGVQTDADGNITAKISKFKIMGVVAGQVGKGLASSILAPAVIIAKITEQFLSINKASVDLRRLTGQTATSFNVLSNGAASATQILETASELTKQIGFNAQSAFSQEVIANAADLKVEMGLAADEAGGIAMMAQTSGISVDSITDSVVATTSAFNRANRSAVSQGVILRDVAKTSDSIKLSLGNNPKALADAASQARRLGVDLNQLNQIANSLLDFESSIESELEAQLLTGNQINLSKARELALNNDIEGVGKELFKNTVDIEKFGRMNRLQQEAQAKALGLTRDQLARIAYQRALDGKMTEEQAAASANVNAEEMKRLTVQENFTASLNKLMGVLAPILDFVGNIFSIPLFGPMAAGATIAIPILAILGGQVASLIGLFTAKTAAAAVDTTAIIAQTGANTGLSTSNIAVATTGSTTAGVFSRMGAALGSFGVSAAASVPVLLSIAAVAAGIGLAFAGMSLALKTIPEILSLITLDKATGLLSLGPAFGMMAAGLASLVIPGALALPILYGLKELGVLGSVGTISQEPIGATQAPAQGMTVQPLVDEIKLMRQEMGTLLKQMVAKDTTINMDGYKMQEQQRLSYVTA